MKHKKTIIFIIIFIVFFITFSIFLTKTVNLLYSKNVLYDYEFNNIKDLVINTTKANITFKESKNELVRVIVYGKDNKDLDITFYKGMDINYLPTTIINNLIDLNIIIETPNNYLNNIYLNTKSGNVKILDGKNIDVRTKSGNITIKEGYIINIETKYGETVIDKVTNSLFVKNEYGDVTIKEADLKCISNIYAMEGNIKVDILNNINVFKKDNVDKKNYKLGLFVYSNNGSIKVNGKDY